MICDAMKVGYQLLVEQSPEVLKEFCSSLFGVDVRFSAKTRTD